MSLSKIAATATIGLALTSPVSFASEKQPIAGEHKGHNPHHRVDDDVNRRRIMLNGILAQQQALIQQQQLGWKQLEIDRLKRDQQWEIDKLKRDQQRAQQLNMAPYGFMIPGSAMPTPGISSYNSVSPSREVVVTRRPIGLLLSDTVGDEGAYIKGLTSVLANTGFFQEGDTIMNINGAKITRAEQVIHAFQKIPYQVGQVKILVLRQDRNYYEVSIPNAFFFQRG